ncbi:hypothetical protein L9F63_001420 [Diploptera punctata]|uniref:Uncharacterized protein n=1 Tax=Diploptera punctata TaxID=6984 RepID=A0AAD8A437_DIPPU|nr:hypothetical protein L9F63_001420 [Diploptera punctata]
MPSLPEDWRRKHACTCIVENGTYFKNTRKISSRILAGNKLTILPTARIWLRVTFISSCYLKTFLGGQRFDGDDEVKTTVREWFASQAGGLYNEGIEKLVPRLDKCLNNGGDYV